MSIIRTTGVLFILLPVAFNVVFFLLQKTFEYPDILRKPTDYVLAKFSAGGRRLVATWYAFAATTMLFIPVSILAPQAIAPDRPLYAALATVVGVLAGLVQVMGLIRWTFVVPYLARTQADAASSQATRDAVAVVFQAFHRYAGVALGEHLGYLMTSLWTAIIASVLTSGALVPAWLAWIGFLPAAGIFVGLFDEAGFKPAGAINAISYIVWSLWLVVVGLFFVIG